MTLKEKNINGTIIRYHEGHAIPKATKLTRLAFMDRFTTAELVSIYTAAKNDIQTEIWLDKVQTAEDINLTDPRIKDALAMLEAGGLIGEGRANEIATP